MRQITTGRLDNAVQATKFINNIIPNPVSPQTVRNVLKENNFRFVVKKKCPLLKKQHWINHLKFAKYHENWIVKDWKRVLWSDETKINRNGSDERVYTWKQKGEQLSNRTPHPQLLYSATYVSHLAYMYHWTALLLILDSSVISILSCFRFTGTSWLICLFEPHFSCSCCPFDLYLPLLFLAHMSHFYSYGSDLFCNLLSTTLHISQPILGFLTCLLSLLWLVLYMTLSD